MGVLIEKNDPADGQLFTDALNEVDYINQTSQGFDFGIVKTPIIKQTINSKSTSVNSDAKPTGYCIRTGAKIPFNTEKPLSYEAYQKWNQFGDADYPEKYCHFSGEPSNGETSVKRPILRKNWQKAKETFGL